MRTQATIRDVARLAEVSLGTVSNHLSGRKPISDRARERIELAIAELRYVPNTAVRVMRGARSAAVAYLVPDNANPFLLEVGRGIEDAAVEHRLVVMVCNTEGEAGREEHYARVLSEMRVRAAFAVATPTSDRLLLGLEQTGAAVVSLGRPSDDSPLPSVSADDERGGYLAMRHLLDQGHRRLAFFGGPGAEPQISARLAGCAKAIAELGEPVELARVDADGSSPTARIAGAEVLLGRPDRPTAVVCANDLLALALETAALRQGLRVPDDIAIVGYDDIDGAITAPVPISSIHIPPYEIGRAAAALAFAEPGPEPVHAVFDPTLVVRESSRVMRT